MGERADHWARGLGLAGSIVPILAGAYLALGGPVRPVSAPVRVTPAALAPTPALPMRAIEAMRVGDRVLAGNPEGAAPEPEVDPATWRRVELVMPREDGSIGIVLLRPLEWVESTGAKAGATIELDLEEMDAVGPARVVAVGPCPPLRPGAGRVVTGTFTHVSRSVVDVRLEGQPEPIGATANHPFYSEDRRGFVAASALRPGERLQAAAGGEVRVAAVAPRPGSHRVYNLEVNAEHVYRVSGIGVLVHNSCADEVVASGLRPASPQGNVSQMVRKLQRRQGDPAAMARIFDGIPLNNAAAERLARNILANPRSLHTGQLTLAGPYSRQQGIAVFDDLGRGIVSTADNHFITFIERARGLTAIFGY